MATRRKVRNEYNKNKKKIKVKERQQQQQNANRSVLFIDFFISNASPPCALVVCKCLVCLVRSSNWPVRCSETTKHDHENNNKTLKKKNHSQLAHASDQRVICRDFLSITIDATSTDCLDMIVSPPPTMYGPTSIAHRRFHVSIVAFYLLVRAFQHYFNCICNLHIYRYFVIPVQ